MRKFYLNENIYGHLSRLDFLKRHISKNASVLEFGCGTGCMVTLPLVLEGYDVTGIDLDEKSIEYGRHAFEDNNCDPKRLVCKRIEDLPDKFDVIIASEVLEHIPNSQIDNKLKCIFDKLKYNGVLLVTVPNGYGWFELESFLWFGAKVGWVLERSQLIKVWYKMKYSLFGVYRDCPYLSTLSSSPHVQHFTLSGIKRLLQNNGFEITDTEGTVLFAGPISDTLFTGIEPVMVANRWLGRHLKTIAAGFMLCARKNDT